MYATNMYNVLGCTKKKTTNGKKAAQTFTTIALNDMGNGMIGSFAILPLPLVVKLSY